MPSKIVDLERLRSRFKELVRLYCEANKISKEAFGEYVDIEKSTMTHLTRQRPDGTYRYKLTDLFIKRCLKKGVFKVNDIYDGMPASKEEAAFWENVEREIARDEKIATAERLGQNVMACLDKLIALGELGQDASVYLEAALIAHSRMEKK